MYFKTSWPPASLEITINISAPENLFALKCYNFVRRRFFEIMPKISKWLYVTSKKWSLDKLIDFWRCCKNVFIPQDLIFLSLADIIPTVNDIFGPLCTLLTSFYPRIFSLELVSYYIIQLHQQNYEFGLVYVPCLCHFIYEFSALSWCIVRPLNWTLIGGCINLLHELQNCF